MWLSIFSSTLFLKAQQIEVYTGEQYIWQNRIKGITTQEHYFNQDNILIRHGKYIFNGSSKVNGTLFTIGISGFYNHSDKHKIWNIDTKITNQNDGIYMSKAIQSNYNKGVAEGNWKLVRNWNITNPEAKGTRNEVANSIFKKGVMIKIKYNSVATGNAWHYSIEGQADSTGASEGLWKISFRFKNENYEDIREYRKGILYKKTLKNISKNEIIIDFIDKDLPNQINLLSSNGYYISNSKFGIHNSYTGSDNLDNELKEFIETIIYESLESFCGEDNDQNKIGGSNNSDIIKIHAKEILKK
jgi:hypothetical protein